VRSLIMALATALCAVLYMSGGLSSPNEHTTKPAGTPALTSTPQMSRPESQVPEAVLRPILNEAAKLANVPPQQLVIVRAEAVVWNDGSLGCPEPGMQYTQALVNGYWVQVRAAERMYDFRARRDGSFRLCPPGHGHPPLPSDRM
jgi:hypothetical protein